MSRLTRKSLKTDMVWFVDHDNNMELEPYEMSPIHNRLVLQKLAEYEETGLTPQNIKQMKLQMICNKSKCEHNWVYIGLDEYICSKCRKRKYT